MPDQNLYDGSLPISESLKQLRLRLLDLTSRNRLLNFRSSAGKTIQIVNVYPNIIWDRVNDNQTLSLIPVPEPKRDEYVIEDGRRQKPDVREHAKGLGINPSFELRQAPSSFPATGSEGKKLQTLYYPEDLSRVCRKVFNHARTAIEETGSNMLYLVFGFMEFYEDDASDKPLMAPLIAVPVFMKQGGSDSQTGQPRFDLSFTGEEVTDNLSLREKLKQQFNIQLPELAGDDSPEDYFEKIEELVKNKDRWKVKRQIVLSILSFAKMVLVNDLDPSRWPANAKGNSLTTHDLVKGVFLGLEEDRSDTDGEEFDVDEHSDNNLPLIYDADTYQHRSLIDALAGKNMVINGPPGTGKSQTITNLIAAGLQRGKKILFVSEKLAALQVVKNRLELAGLGKFVLELHSNKTNKKRFLEELEDRMKSKFPEPHDLPAKMQALEQRRLELKRYADTLNSVIGNELGLTVNQVLWAAETHRQACGDDAKNLDDITVAKAPSIRADDLDVRRNAISSLARHFDEIVEYGPEHPWYGFFPVSIKPGDDLVVQQYLKNLVAATEEVEERSSKLGGLLPSGIVIGSKQARALGEKVAKIQAPPLALVVDLLPALFSPKDPEGRDSFEVVETLKKQMAEVASLSEQIQGKLKALDRVNAQSLQDVQDAILSLDKYKLSSTALAALRQLLAQMVHASQTVETRLHQLEEYAKLTGLPLTGTHDNLKQIAALVTIGSNALPELLVYRHSRLGQPSARESLDQAKKTAAELAAQSESVNQLFYLDERPDATALSHAIHTFREGDTWYRIFQSEWRRAKKFYRGLARSKAKLTTDERLKNCESLSYFFKKQDTFNRSDEYREQLGPLFKGEATDFYKLELLIDWYAQSLAAMFELAIPPERFDLTSVTPFTLAQLHKVNTECQEHMKELLPAILFIEGVVSQLGLQDRDKLSDRIRLLVNCAAEISVALVTVGQHEAGDSATPIDIRKSIQDKLVLDASIGRLNGNVKASGLLGKYFKGQQTATTEISATLEWGSQVAYGRLPDPLVLRILQTDVKEYLPSLRENLKQTIAAWDKVAGFAGNMATLGSFDWSKWNSHIKLEQDETPLKIRERAEIALVGLDELLPWAQYNNARVKLEEYGLAVFTERLESGEIASGKLEDGLLYRLHASIAQSIFRSRPELATFSTTKHNQIREEFATLDRDIIKLRGKECAHQIAKGAQLLPGTKGAHVEDYTECELLYRLIPQQRPRVPIRQILRRAGKSVQAMKPCFMMGPMAVAQYLEPGAMQFDMVVIDEASQLTPEEAIGAFGRAKQVIVVGDPKQLPPTNFFNRMSTTDEGDMDEDSAISTIAGQESILDVCLGLMPERMLRLHYRSRHESLIAFSNINFYDGKLVVFPSPFPRSKRLGLQYHHIKNGVYQNKQNQPEAMRVVDAIIDHMRCHPDDSLGICTLNMFQRDLIEELLEKRIKAFPECDAYRAKWEEEGWPFFIKNLENVQGDERDVIFISTTFGKAPGTTVVRQNFGPISRPTGWRRLNVLFTRARKSVHLYTSMEAEDIPVDQTTPEGTKALKGYLEYARSGVIANVTETDREPDSDFEVAVANVLRGKGFSVRPQLGVAGYFIDLVVKHPVRPGEYIAAIECDGASYHSGATVRDRDRIRQEILESLGWHGKIWRIWSTDWFRNPLREIQKLISFLEERIKECDLEPVPYHDEVVPEVVESSLSGEELDTTISQLVLSLASEDEALSVQVGDHLTYIDTAQPDNKLHIQIVEGPDRLDEGIINEARPLAQVLLDAEVGDEVELSIPGRATRILKVMKIDRVG